MLYWQLTRLANPFLLLMLLIGAALIRCWCQPAPGIRRRLIAVTGSYLALFVYSLPITAYVFSGTLERAYPPLGVRPVEAQAIVVLGGGVQPPSKPGEATEIGETSLWRCVHAARIYQDGAACPLFVIGGNPYGVRGDAVARVMATTLERFGIPPTDLIVEDVSRDTYENTIAATALLKERGLARVVLVTSAAHLRRAVHLFRAQGLEVFPAGCNYAAAPAWDLFSWLPNAHATELNQQAVHEWMGIVKLWGQGRW